MKRKIVQVVVYVETDGDMENGISSDSTLVALADDGTLWRQAFSSPSVASDVFWNRLPDLPDTGVGK